MGAWRVGTFDNDTACDWAYDLEKSEDLLAVRRVIGRTPAVADDYLDGDLACETLAACEVIARLRGNWGPRNPYTETVDAWVEPHQVVPEPELVQAAMRAIDRVLDSPSELLELWKESEDFDAWFEAVMELRNRIRAQ
jgi:hypothetical protein